MSALSSPVETAIVALLQAYVQQPMQFMREVGLQASLRDRIAGLLQPVTCDVKILDVDRAPHTAEAVQGWVVQRVQLEAKVCQGGCSPRDRSDLVVLKSSRTVTLTRYPNGVLDIVSRIQADDVEAVVELKAACSFDKEQRHLFRQDIQKLLDLAPDTQFDRHFVLVDKSLHVPLAPSLPIRQRACQASPVDGWHTEDEATINNEWSAKAKEECWTKSPHPHLTDTLPVERRYVHVWDLASAQDTLAVRHRYATVAAKTAQQR